MHGTRRTRETPEAIKARKEREQSKLKEYLSLTDHVMARKKSSDWSKEAFDATTKLLQINPEFYTVWNYRRNVMLNGLFMNSTPDIINDILSEDLSMTTAALKAHPKVYWIWNHRRWCLENVPEGPAGTQDWKKANWNRELAVVEKMLDADARNFHAWNYRRYVLANTPEQRPETAELAYTTRKIEANFSNFSAWHQRSKVYVSLWESGKLNKDKCIEAELELVKNAMYTDPNDQSAWLYHRWLIGDGQNHHILASEIAAIEELLEEQPDSKWCLESLVHYRRLLVRNHAMVIGKEESERILRQCIEFLQQLQTLDTPRKRRYQDILDRLSVAKQ
ncbi:rab-protein geranylgeranyltransferase [Heliocybe sulcata]|uniref:Geranylgeranyl transferase type-2 subunit alpha n=1 Tax=Heliocybe sulcata TaxID=5364 RepID=A0A5C3NEB9_9AGAM|nr:rab-protein geranylgeranyltransferase [Heliocybe sulcata]